MGRGQPHSSFSDTWSQAGGWSIPSISVSRARAILIPSRGLGRGIGKADDFSCGAGHKLLHIFSFLQEDFNPPGRFNYSLLGLPRS